MVRRYFGSMDLISTDKKWFYNTEGTEFSGFFFDYAGQLIGLRSKYDWGPFDTFTAAKKDAIEYFEADKLNIKISMMDIRESRAKNIKEHTAE